MAPFLNLLIAVILFGLGGGATILLFSRWRKLARNKVPASISPPEPLSSSWRYIIFPAAILLFSIIIVAFFYHQLPAELAYHFKPDGAADRWQSREVVTAWLLIPQLFLTLLAAVITIGIARLRVIAPKANGGVNPKSIISLMGNIIGLPQLILCFAILDIFSYNAYQIRFIPLWVFSLVVMGIGAIVLSLFFISALRRANRTAG